MIEASLVVRVTFECIQTLLNLDMHVNDQLSQDLEAKFQQLLSDLDDVQSLIREPLETSNPAAPSPIRRTSSQGTDNGLRNPKKEVEEATKFSIEYDGPVPCSFSLDQDPVETKDEKSRKKIGFEGREGEPCSNLAWLVMGVLKDCCRFWLPKLQENLNPRSRQEVTPDLLKQLSKEYWNSSTGGKGKLDQMAFDNLRWEFYDLDYADRVMQSGDRVDLVPDIVEIQIKVVEETLFVIRLAVVNNRLCMVARDLVVKARHSSHHCPTKDDEDWAESILATLDHTVHKSLLEKCRRVRTDVNAWKTALAHLGKERMIRFYKHTVRIRDLPKGYISALVNKPAFLQENVKYKGKPGIYEVGSRPNDLISVREWGEKHGVWLSCDVWDVAQQICYDPGWWAELEASTYLHRKALRMDGDISCTDGLTSASRAVINEYQSFQMPMRHELMDCVRRWHRQRPKEWTVRIGHITCAISQMKLEADENLRLDLVHDGNCSALSWKLGKFDDPLLIDRPLLTQLILRRKHDSQDWDAVKKEFKARRWTCVPKETSLNRYIVHANGNTYEAEVTRDGPVQHVTWTPDEDVAGSPTTTDQDSPVIQAGNTETIVSELRIADNCRYD